MSTYTSTTDCWAEQAVPAKNHDQSAKLWLSNVASNNDYAYIHFGRPFPYGATIDTGNLRVKLGTAWSGQTITAKRITESWKENQLNWNNKPAVSATNAATITVTGSDTDEKVFDISAILADVSAGGAFFGIRLETNSSSVRKVYATDETTAALRPQLDIEWTVLPEAPVNLLPSGGLGVSPAKPKLSWQFSESFLELDEQQSACQVQVSTSTSFASPAYDSTMVANTESMFDLNAPPSGAGAFSALSDGNVRYWRVRVQDAAGQTSAWSDVVSFARTVYGTLVLDNPDSGTPVVDDLTPAIGWTLTTTTQEAFEIRLYKVAGNGALKELYHQPRTVSTDSIFTLPKGYIKSASNYSVRLRVWDTHTRIGIQGDPGYQQIDRAFTYSRAGGPAAVPSLTATTNGPKVTLTFTRSAQPDYFCLKVDGQEVEPRLDPTDFFASGTTYVLNYWGATPRVQSTYEIEAVNLTSGHLKHSNGNDTATATTNPTGIYLIDPDDSAYVRLVGQDGGVDLNIGESGTTYTLPGSRNKVRITDAMLGYEGTVSGYLSSTSERDTFLDLKGRMKPVRLIASDLNILVVMEEGGSTPTWIPGDRLYRTSVGVFQVDSENSFAVAGL